MPVWKLEELAEIVGGKLIGSGKCIVDNIVLDSRKAVDDSLFVPLSGPNADGHDYIKSAFRNGARAAFASKPINLENNMNSLIMVNDTLVALQRMATAHLLRINPKVVAVTGSVGKTTTKEFIATILSESFNTFRSKGNLNSEEGLPLTLCELNDNHQVAVVEMGMRGMGQIAELTRIAPPDIAVITNIGITHMELLGTQENIALAKSEIIAGLKNNGVVVLNGDDLWCKEIGKRHQGRILRYGLDSVNDIVPMNMCVDQEGKHHFDLAYYEETAHVDMPVAGKHNVYNALAGAAVGIALGMSVVDIARGIARFKTIEKRQRLVFNNGLSILDDTYNASPQSVRAGLDQLRYLDCDGRRIAVLGDMLELGPRSEELHFDVGKVIPSYGVDILVCRGQWAQQYGRGAMVSGMSRNQIYYATDNESVVQILRNIAIEGDALLIKGSRGLRMEEVVDALVKE